MNSLVTRFAIAFLVLASGMMGWMINEFLWFGEEFLAGLTVIAIPAFALIAFNHLKNDETQSRRLRRVRRA